VASIRRSGEELSAFVRESPVHRPAIVAAVRSFAESLPRGARVLDAGAGMAPYRELFAHCDYVTHDWPASPHERAAQADVVADLRSLPVADGGFDAALCTEVLEHIATPVDAVSELRRVLRPGGRMLVTVPFVAQLHEEPHDHYRYTSFGLGGLLERGGFEVDAVEPLTGYFRTLVHTLRVGGLAIRARDRRSRPATRLAGFLLQALSVVLHPPARVLDRLDEHRGLPLGWAALASVPGCD
jgi:SAM-dependent methyltransferase